MDENGVPLVVTTTNLVYRYKSGRFVRFTDVDNVRHVFFGKDNHIYVTKVDESGLFMMNYSCCEYPLITDEDIDSTSIDISPSSNIFTYDSNWYFKVGVK